MKIVRPLSFALPLPLPLSLALFAAGAPSWALMAEPMNTTQEGMGGMAGPKGTPAGMSERQAMMEQRTDMTQTMIEMTVDRRPQTPAQP